MPIVFPVAIPFITLVAVLGSFILLRTETLWLRPLVQSLQHPHGNWFKRQILKAAGAVAAATLFVEKHVRLALSHFADDSLHFLTRFFSGVAAALHYTYKEVGSIAGDVADALNYLRHHTIPALIHAALFPVRLLAQEALRVAHRSISLVHKAEHDFTRGIDRLEHGLKSWVLTRIHGIDRLIREHVLPRLRTVEREVAVTIPRELHGIDTRLKRVERALGLGIIGALVYRILARVAPWLFCRNWKRLGPRVCGINPLLIEEAFALFLTAEAIQNLPTLVRVMQGVAKETAEGIKELAEV